LADAHSGLRRAVLGTTFAALILTTAALAACGSTAAAPHASGAPRATTSASSSSGGTSSGAASAPTGGTPAGAPLSISASYGALTPFTAPVWVAQQDGLFKKYGLNVHLERAEGPTGLAGLGSGELNVIQQGTPLLSAVAKGVDVQFVLALSSGTGFGIYTRPGLKLSSVAQLRGHRIGISYAGSSDDQAFTFFARQQGLNPNQGFQYVALHNAEGVMASMLRGQVDAAVFDPVDAATATAHGATLLATITTPWVQTGLATSRAYASAHRTALDDYLKAVMAGIHVCKTDRQACEAAIRQYAHMANPQLLNQAYARTLPLWPYPPLVSRTGIANMIKASSLPAVKRLKPSQAYDNSYVKAILASGFKP
jgi:ABC-type nitrate/sulfonate/bicarbonate transport system substrate-binding protein